jgi:anaerobic selenocysteine-containing dehydrogenase
MALGIPRLAEAQPGAEADAQTAGGSPRMQSYKSTCVNCVNFCGIEVTTQDGVIRSIGPDPARRDIFNHGVCPKGVSGAYTIYNPYRLKVPLKRTNPEKGLDQDPGWVEIGWEEAFDTMTERLAAIRAEEPAKFIWQHGHGKYLIGDKFPKAFGKAFGTPNVIHRTTTCESARHVGDDITWGYHGYLPDIDHCDLFVVFGANYMEAEQFSRWLDHAVTHARERGMKIISVEPRLSHVGAKADQWIPVRPGKDVAIVLAVTRQLIEAGQYDEDFLTTYTNAPQLVGPDGRIRRDEADEPLVWDTLTETARPYADGVVPALRGTYRVGDEALQTGFDRYAESLTEMTPQAAAEIAGVSAETIVDLARQIGSAARLGTTTRIGDFSHRYRPVSIHTWRGMTAKEHGVQTWRSALMLQMLLGIPDAIGGNKLGKVLNKTAFMAPSKCEYPPKRVDLAKSVYFPNGHHDVCQQVALTVLDPGAFGLEYVPEMQVFYATNRPVSTSDTGPQLESLKKTFNVTIETHMTETAWMSDIVLPDRAYLESWHFSPVRANPHAKQVGIRRPIVNAFDLPHDGYSILWELAKRLGIRDAYAAALNDAWHCEDPTFETGRDYSARDAVEVLWLNATKGTPFQVAIDEGFVGKQLEPKDVYMKGIEAKMKGPGTAKMTFYADCMLGTLEKLKKTVAEHGIENIDLDASAIAFSPFPIKAHAFPTPHREAADWPFYLITFKRMYRNQTSNDNTNPILNFALGDDTISNAIMINTATATELGLREGDTAVVETRLGQVSGPVKLTQGIRPDTIGISYHYGAEVPTLPAWSRKGIDVNRIIELHPDRISGMNSYNDTKCRVYPA